jgi:hypothetical protein
MLRSNLSKVFGTGILVAGIAVLPLSVASAAKAEATSDYQLGRHGVSLPTMTNADKSTAMNSSDSANSEQLSNYQLGRHNGSEANMMDAGKSTTSMSKENLRSEITNDYQIGRHG